MKFENYFPIWNQLTADQKNRTQQGLITRKVEKGTIIHNGNMDCTGLLLVKTGQLVHIFSLMRGVRLPFIACLIEICACFPPPA